MKWTRISPRGDRPCATDGCMRSAQWHGEAGGVGSEYCSTCRDGIDDMAVRDAARGVLSFDWSDNDPDAVAAIERLRAAMRNM